MVRCYFFSFPFSILHFCPLNKRKKQLLIHSGVQTDRPHQCLVIKIHFGTAQSAIRPTNFNQGFHMYTNIAKQLNFLSKATEFTHEKKSRTELPCVGPAVSSVGCRLNATYSACLPGVGGASGGRGLATAASGAGQRL